MRDKLLEASGWELIGFTRLAADNFKKTGKVDNDYSALAGVRAVWGMKAQGEESFEHPQFVALLRDRFDDDTRNHVRIALNQHPCFQAIIVGPEHSVEQGPVELIRRKLLENIRAELVFEVTEGMGHLRRPHPFAEAIPGKEVFIRSGHQCTDIFSDLFDSPVVPALWRVDNDIDLVRPAAFDD